jgi:nucleotide-binding universal stress UspA family protein
MPRIFLLGECCCDGCHGVWTQSRYRHKSPVVTCIHRDYILVMDVTTPCMFCHWLEPCTCLALLAEDKFMNIGSDLAKGPIVVGTDFSDASQAVVEYAVTLAIAESKPLYLAYAMPVVPEDSPSILEIQQDELRSQVKTAAATMNRHGLTAEGVFTMGSATHELIRIGNRLDAACIVVGTEGLSGLSRFLLGSVAEAVIRKADRPVIVVGPEAAKRAKKTLPWKHLMLACDTTRGVTEAARLAGNIALSHHAHLTIFNVKEDGLENLSEDQFESMEQMMSRKAWLTVKPQCLIRAGDPAKEIIRMVEDSQADLLVMSVHNGGELLTHLRGGIIAKILRMSRCPAMILRDLAAPHHARNVPLASHHGVTA